MNRMMQVMKIVAIASAFIIAAGAQEPSEQKKVGTQETVAPKPGPEMEHIKFLIGRWNTDSEYEKTPMIPEGGKSTGWYEAHLGPGGFSIIADFEENGPLGPEIGHEVISWDPKQEVYTVVTVGNAFPGAVIGKSRWEGDKLVTEHDFSENGTTMHLRSEYSDIKERSTRIEEFVQVGENPAQLLYKSYAVKK
ncbi:MAG: hypothetical protein WCD49_01250 [Candidatus Acidiferrales bacterium]